MAQWKNKRDAYCKVCEARMLDEGRPHRCNTCRSWGPGTSFTDRIVKRQEFKRFICNSCQGRDAERQCSYCEKLQPQSSFLAGRWGKVLSRRVCIDCANEKKCSICERTGDKRFYAAEDWDKSSQRRRSKDCVLRHCNQCRKSQRREAFAKEQWFLGDGAGVCSKCYKRRCMKCMLAEARTAFTDAVWQLPDTAAAIYCKLCTKSDREYGKWTCFGTGCNIRLPKEQFVLAKQRFSESQIGHAKYRVRDTCITARDALKECIKASNALAVSTHRRA